MYVGAARYKRWLLLIVSYHGFAGFGPERHFGVARTDCMLYIFQCLCRLRIRLNSEHKV